ncbi:MAG: hypothetical protein PHH59_01075 [Methylovulum sp.]|nr:hypothetical protein [Methylovulum sp.]
MTYFAVSVEAAPPAGLLGPLLSDPQAVKVATATTNKTNELINFINFSKMTVNRMFLAVVR